MKTSSLIIGGVIGVATLWSAGWFVGKTLYVEPEADKVVEQLRSGDVFFSFDSRRIAGFPFAYEVEYAGVKISDSSTLWQWSAATMSAGSGIADGGALVLTPSDASKLTIEPAAIGGEADDAPLVFDIKTDGLTIRLVQTAAAVETALTAAALTADQAAPAALISDGKLRVADLAVTVSNGYTDGTATASMTAAEFETRYTISEDGVSSSMTNSVATGLKVNFKADNLDAEDFKAFVAAGGEGELTLSQESATGTFGSTGGPSTPPMSLSNSSGVAEMGIRVVDGRAAYSASLMDLQVVSADDAGSVLPAGAADLGEMAVWFEMPLRKSVQPAPYRIGMKLIDLTLDEAGWAQIDPAKAISRSPVSLVMDLGGGVRVLTDLGGDTFGQPPVDLETLNISEISLTGLGIVGKATGELNVAGNASQPDGDVQVTLSGVFALLDQLVAGGLVAPEEAGVYRSIIAGFARPGASPDELIADISIADGTVSINGQPLQ